MNKTKNINQVYDIISGQLVTLYTYELLNKNYRNDYEILNVSK